MSYSADTASARPADLQFDYAEASGSGAQTASRIGMAGHGYYAGASSMPATESGGFGRFLRALGYGVGAGIVGAGLYYAVLALTGYEVGLISILVGLMVGAAVRAGAQGRGGWLYQLMAVGLTYTAIVSTYIPLILDGMAAEQAPAQTAAASAETEPGDEAPTQAEVRSFLTGNPIGWVFLLGLAFAAPFLAGFENIMGILIIAFGLYQAWKINTRTEDGGLEPAGAMA